MKRQRIAAAVIPELDYPDASANSVVMAGLEARLSGTVYA